MTDLNLSPIEYAGPLVKLDKHNLPDLDDLMLDVLMDGDIRPNLLYDEWEDDRETRIYGSRDYGGEARVGYFRKNPCACGEGHGFDLGEVRMDDDGNPVGKAARGAFLGVFFE